MPLNAPLPYKTKLTALHTTTIYQHLKCFNVIISSIDVHSSTLFSNHFILHDSPAVVNDRKLILVSFEVGFIFVHTTLVL